MFTFSEGEGELSLPQPQPFRYQNYFLMLFIVVPQAEFIYLLL